MIAQQETSFYSKVPENSLTVPVLETVGNRELPDSHPNESQRRALKELARSLRPRLSSRELAYLASALEVEANARRAEEGGRAGSAEDLR